MNPEVIRRALLTFSSNNFVINYEIRFSIQYQAVNYLYIFHWSDESRRTTLGVTRYLFNYLKVFCPPIPLLPSHSPLPTPTPRTNSVALIFIRNCKLKFVLGNPIRTKLDNFVLGV